MVHDLTTPVSGMVCHPWASTATSVNLSTKFEVSNSTHYKDSL